MAITIYPIVHKHATVYIIRGSGRCVLFDCGWQDSFPAIKSALSKYGVDFGQIAGLFVSHFHPDHAGSVELLRRHGVTPLILERQMPYVNRLNAFFAQSKNDPGRRYVPLDASIVKPITPDNAKSFLAGCGIDGKVLYTPGHSDDSISLIAGGAGFVGDLPTLENAGFFGNPEISNSWKAILDCGVTRLYPAHGPNFPSKKGESAML